MRASHIPSNVPRSEKQLQNQRLRSKSTRTLQEEAQESDASLPIIHHHLVQISQRRIYRMRLSTPAKSPLGHLKLLDTVGFGGFRLLLTVLFLVGLLGHSRRALRLGHDALLCFRLLRLGFREELQF